MSVPDNKVRQSNSLSYEYLHLPDQLLGGFLSVVYARNEYKYLGKTSGKVLASQALPVENVFAAW